MELDRSNNAHRSFVHRAAPVVRCLINTLILLFIAVSLGGLIAWLIFHPRVPNFHIKSLHITNFTTLAGNNETLPLDYRIEFIVENPNSKINLLFLDMDVCIAYENKIRYEISTTHLPEFPVSKRGIYSKVVKMRTRVSWGSVEGGTIAAEMGAELARKQVLTYNVIMEAAAVFTDGKWIHKQRKVKAECRNLTTTLGFKKRAVDMVGNGHMISKGHRERDCNSFFITA